MFDQNVVIQCCSNGLPKKQQQFRSQLNSRLLSVGGDSEDTNDMHRAAGQSNLLPLSPISILECPSLRIRCNGVTIHDRPCSMMKPLTTPIEIYPQCMQQRDKNPKMYVHKAFIDSIYIDSVHARGYMHVVLIHTLNSIRIVIDRRSTHTWLS